MKVETKTFDLVSKIGYVVCNEVNYSVRMGASLEKALQVVTNSFNNSITKWREAKADGSPYTLAEITEVYNAYNSAE